MKKALLVFAKMPEPGKVKTRLVPPLSTEEAAELYGCMLADTLTNITRLDEVAKLLFYEGPPDADRFFRETFPSLPTFRQKGNNLGERMSEAFAAAFAMGFDSVAAIGTDSPDLPVEFIAKCFTLLRENDLVFGPAEDGGYYLLGMDRLHHGLFGPIPWSTCKVYETSVNIAETLGLKVAALPEWHDIDSETDLYRPNLAYSDTALLTRGFVRNFVARRATVKSGYLSTSGAYPRTSR